jgi:hypothetical protein
MQIHKIAQSIKSKDFTSVDVRRLSGIFEDFKDVSEWALRNMEEWKANGEYDITPEEAQKRLSYQLSRLGLK